MKALLKLKNKKLYLDWEFRYDKIPNWIKVTIKNERAFKATLNFTKKVT